MNIVTLAAGRAILITGPIVAAIDLGEFNSRQLHLASELAYAGGQPLLLLTVGENESDEHDLAVRLRHRAHDLEPVQPQAVIARTGEAAEEIARCAAAEHSGLVVMGLRDPGLGKPGAIAATVLHSGKTFVLAVPSTSWDDRINDLVRAPKRKAV
jgi:hypothetical protein